MAGVRVAPARSRAELEAFVELPWRLYAGNPCWVPPIRSEVRRLLTPGRHPFWEHARRQLLLAWRGERVVGRVAAVVDDATNELAGERAGAWGFFEAERDPEVVGCLLSAAEAWLRGQGMAFMRGPLSPSTNYEVGMLVEGFGKPPAFMMAYNPPHYPELVALCGQHKEKDLLSFRYEVDLAAGRPEWVESAFRKLEASDELSVRTGRRGHTREDLRLMNRLYAECWRDNWGFAPASDAEVLDSARLLSHIADLELGFFLCYRGEPVGICLLVPDISPLLVRLDGRGGLRALLELHLRRRQLPGLRALLFGVKPAFRQMGLPLLALLHLRDALATRPQYRWVELGWTLEDNDAINRLLADAGLHPSSRWRIYRREL